MWRGGVWCVCACVCAVCVCCVVVSWSSSGGKLARSSRVTLPLHNETIPDGMATGEFMMFKPKKPDDNGPKSHRALCMSNHAFTTLSGLVMEQTVTETESSMWVAGRVP